MRVSPNVTVTVIAQCKWCVDLPSPHHTDSGSVGPILSLVFTCLSVSPNKQTIIPKRKGLHLFVYLQSLTEKLILLK